MDAATDASEPVPTVEFTDLRSGFHIRATMIEGVEWFVAKDVCDVLGIKNSRDALKKLDEDERHDVGLTDAIGRSQPTSAINESGLYALILRSKKPNARAFRKWVTAEVLPAIRKTGGYSLGGDASEITRMEVERLQKQIAAVGVPFPYAEKAAKAAFRAKLAAMRAALVGKTESRLAIDGQRPGGTFTVKFTEDSILRVLSEPMRVSRLCERTMAETGMSHATFYRVLARLRSSGRVHDRADRPEVEQVWVEGAPIMG